MGYTPTMIPPSEPRRNGAMLLAVLLWALASCSPPSGTVGEDGDADVSEDADLDRDAWTRPDSDYEAPTCETSTTFADPEPATLMLQVDTSGSMNCRADNASCATGDPTPAPDDSRWDVFRIALETALVALPDATSVGLMHFPVTFSCAAAPPDVPIATLAENRDMLIATIDGIVPEGITPTHDGVLFALEQLRGTAADNRFLVLATDGQATVCSGCDAACSWDALDADNIQLVADIAAAATDESIPTFVIGVPGSSAYASTLSAMASASGTARSATCSDHGPEYCHFDLTDPTLDFAAALGETLAAISEAVLGCEYVIPDNPDGHFDPTQVNIRLTLSDGTEEVIGRDPTGSNGWDYNADETAIILKGEACEHAREATSGRIDIYFGCPTILI